MQLENCLCGSRDQGEKDDMRITKKRQMSLLPRSAVLPTTLTRSDEFDEDLDSPAKEEIGG